MGAAFAARLRIKGNVLFVPPQVMVCFPGDFTSDDLSIQRDVQGIKVRIKDAPA